MALVLDAGAFLALERGSRELMALLKDEARNDETPTTHGAVIGQVWRGGARQVGLARLLPVVEIEPLDEDLGRRAGVLLGISDTSDVVDASVVLLANDGDHILTSDPSDLAVLAEAAGLHVDIIAV